MATRNQVSDHLHRQFSALVAETDQCDYDDTVTGYGPDIDNALRAMGVGESSLSGYTIADGDVLKAFASAEYYTLHRLHALLSVQAASFSTGPHSEDGNNLVDQVEKLAAAAQKKAEALGVAVGGDTMSLAWLTLDWAEPEIP